MEIKEDKKMVPCKGAKSKVVHVPLLKCQECEWHEGLEQVKAGHKDIPPVELVKCNKPWTIRVAYLTEGPR